MSFLRDLISMVSSYIQFEDADTKESLINDNTINIDGDHEISYKEAAAYNTSPATITITGESFKEFRYFTGITVCKIIGENLKIIYIPTTFTGNSQISPFASCPLLETLGIFGPIDLHNGSPFGSRWALKNVIIFGQPSDIIKSGVGGLGWFGLTNHGQGKFYDKNNQEINSITIEDNNFIISQGILMSCKSINTIHGNNKLIAINNRAFENSVLSSIDGLDNLTSIGMNAFSKTLLTTFIANNVTNAILGSFAKCTNLETVSLSKVTTLSGSTVSDWGAFSECTSLVNVNIPNLTNIGYKCFYQCSNLVTLSSTNITTIDKRAFGGCAKLETLNTSNITTINELAFINCSKFDSKNFNNVTSIGIGALFNTGLTEVEFKNANFTTIPSDTDANRNYGVFQNCSKLTKIDAPNVTFIGKTAFKNCTSLTTITWDWDNITTIGANAFENCTALNFNSITFGVNSVISTIGGQAFKGSAIKNITINNNTLHYLTGFNNTSMNSVVAPNVTSIGSNAFIQGGVTNMMSFPNVTVIDKNAFYQTNFGNGKIDLYNIVKFDDSAFWGSTSLHSLGDNFNWSTVKYIGTAVFRETCITMPRELNCKIIGHQAFNLNAGGSYPNINNKNEKYIIFRFDGSDISDINDYPTGTNGQNLIRKGVVGFIQYLTFKQSPLGAIQVVYIPDSEPDENNKTIKDYYLESIWGQLTIGNTNTLLSFRTYSEGNANDGVSIT